MWDFENRQAKASVDKLLLQKDMGTKIDMLKKVEADNEYYKTHFFRNQQQSTYGGCGSMSPLQDPLRVKMVVISFLEVRSGGVSTGQVDSWVLNALKAACNGI